ncbi:MAG: hypothetical protein ACRDRP_23775 [Pseudonocardiaceae bacterium]
MRSHYVIMVERFRVRTLLVGLLLGRYHSIRRSATIARNLT